MKQTIAVYHRPPPPGGGGHPPTRKKKQRRRREDEEEKSPHAGQRLWPARPYYTTFSVGLMSQDFPILTTQRYPWRPGNPHKISKCCENTMSYKHFLCNFGGPVWGPGSQNIKETHCFIAFLCNSGCPFGDLGSQNIKATHSLMSISCSKDFLVAFQEQKCQ